jgi:dTDP-4-dehydrorhamnose 3,5-epimerase-like enzyme
MKISNTSLSGVLIIEPRVFHDERGYFFESFNTPLSEVLEIFIIASINISNSQSESLFSCNIIYSIEPRVFHDERGYFFESFNEKNFKENIDPNVIFKLDNQNTTERSIRNFHYSLYQYQ